MAVEKCVVCEEKHELHFNPYTDKEDTCKDCLKRQDEELI